MTDPTTILDYAKQRSKNASDAVKRVQQRLAAAQAAITTKSDELSKATTAFANLDKEANEVRKKLATVPTPADGDALLDALEQLIIRSRGKRAAILKIQFELDAARADAESAQTELQAATALMSSSASQVKLAEPAHNQREILKAALDSLSGLSTGAGGMLGSPAFSDAAARIKADLPDELTARARERQSAEAARLVKIAADAQAPDDATLHERDRNGGLTGKTETTWALFSRAEAAARDSVNSAKSRFDQAKAILAQVADPKHSPLTLEQAARISTADPTLKKARIDAAAEEKTHDDALKNVDAARNDLNAKILEAIAGNKNPDDVSRTGLEEAESTFSLLDDAWRQKEKARDDKLAAVDVSKANLAKAIQAVIDKKDPDADAKLNTAQKALAEAQLALETAEREYEKSNHGILHAWQSAVPDTMWQLFDDFEEANRTLGLLNLLDPNNLKTELTKAEEDYVKARLDADNSANILEQLAAEQARRTGRGSTARQNEGNCLFGALRGDS